MKTKNLLEEIDQIKSSITLLAACKAYEHKKINAYINDLHYFSLILVSKVWGILEAKKITDEEKGESLKLLAREY